MKTHAHQHSRRPLPNNRKRLLRGEAIQQIRDSDLQTLGEHHDFRVVQPAHAGFDLCKRATGHIPTNRLTTGCKLLLTEAARNSQFSHAATRKIKFSRVHCSVFGA